VNRPGLVTAGAACDAGAVNLQVAPGAGGGGGGSTPPVIGAETLTVTSSQLSSVFGQPVTFTAILTPAPNCGLVTWSIDGQAQGTGAPVSGGAAALGTLSNLAVGGHTVQATFAGCTGFGVATGGITQIVGKAATTTSATTSGSGLTATVAPVAPGAGAPTGTVSFAVDGVTVGSSALSGGTATFAYALGSSPHVVAATYAGDGNFTGSAGSNSTSTSTTLKNPTITAAIVSAHPESAAFWYRNPVTVVFTCTPGSAPLSATGCPAPITLRTSGVAQSVTVSVTATDGGTASVTKSPINIDLSAPTAVHVHGVVQRATYSHANGHRHVTCSATDLLSGIASCTVSKRSNTTRHFVKVHYTLKATNNAGESTTVHGYYRYHRI
jgi:hypothetical protein